MLADDLHKISRLIFLIKKWFSMMSITILNDAFKG